MQKDSFFKRLHEYFNERFNLWQFIPFSAVLAGVLASGTQAYITHEILIAPLFLTIGAFFLFLLRLRIFDEFKDYYHDLKYYPYRPVPRGLIAKEELLGLLIPIIFFEFVIAFVSGTDGFILFLLAFGYSLLMLKEFYVQGWIRSHFGVYIFAHEVLVLPLFFYLCAISGFKFIFFREHFFWYLIVCVGSFLFLLEITRKIRPRGMEIASKDTYTAQYGIRGALLLIVVVSFISIVSLMKLSGVFNLRVPLLVSSLMFLAFCWRLYEFDRRPTIQTSKNVFIFSIYFVFSSCVLMFIFFVK